MTYFSWVAVNQHPCRGSIVCSLMSYSRTQHDGAWKQRRVYRIPYNSLTVYCILPPYSRTVALKTLSMLFCHIWSTKINSNIIFSSFFLFYHLLLFFEYISISDSTWNFTINLLMRNILSYQFILESYWIQK